MFLYGFVLTDHGAFSRILWFGNYVFLPSIVITSLEGASRSAGRLLVCLHYVASRFSTLHPRWCQRRAVNLIVAFPRDLFISFFET